jgi:hypothetical protein
MHFDFFLAPGAPASSGSATMKVAKPAWAQPKNHHLQTNQGDIQSHLPYVPVAIHAPFSRSLSYLLPKPDNRSYRMNVR